MATDEQARGAPPRSPGDAADAEALRERLRAAEATVAELRAQLVEAHRVLLERDTLAQDLLKRLSRSEWEIRHIRGSRAWRIVSAFWGLRGGPRRA